MDPSPVRLHHSTAAEIKARLDAERSHAVFLVVRGPGREQRIVPLDEHGGRVTIGRGDAADVCLQGDSRVSRLHAELAPAGGEWLLVDDGLSRNGSFVNEERVVGRRRLADRDVIRIGASYLVFRRPGGGEDGTAYDSDGVSPTLTPAQRRVLVALCRPLAGNHMSASPATNPQIAQELFLSVPAVKTHMRALFNALAIDDDLAQNQKRRRVVERAFQCGLVSEHDF
jgi:pSer/pThr/pTyr-binding forkhead associated (FHA) protein